MTDKTKIWLKGAISAIIAGAANAVTVVIIDPITFNLFQGGAMQLLSVVIVSAIVGLALYLKSSPLPE